MHSFLVELFKIGQGMKVYNVKGDKHFSSMDEYPKQEDEFMDYFPHDICIYRGTYDRMAVVVNYTHKNNYTLKEMKYHRPNLLKYLQYTGLWTWEHKYETMKLRSAGWVKFACYAYNWMTDVEKQLIQQMQKQMVKEGNLGTPPRLELCEREVKDMVPNDWHTTERAAGRRPVQREQSTWVRCHTFEVRCEVEQYEEIERLLCESHINFPEYYEYVPFGLRQEHQQAYWARMNEHNRFLDSTAYITVQGVHEKSMTSATRRQHKGHSFHVIEEATSSC